MRANFKITGYRKIHTLYFLILFTSSFIWKNAYYRYGDHILISAGTLKFPLYGKMPITGRITMFFYQLELSKQVFAPDKSFQIPCHNFTSARNYTQEIFL